LQIRDGFLWEFHDAVLVIGAMQVCSIQNYDTILLIFVAFQEALEMKRKTPSSLLGSMEMQS